MCHRHGSEQLVVVLITVQVLHKNLHLKSYIIQLTQELKQINTDFHHKIFFTDEIHFYLGGNVNNQINRFGERNNHTPFMDLRKVIVWCGFSETWLDHTCFHNDAGETIPINDVRYREMITNFCGTNWKRLMWMMFISNKTVCSATQRERLCNYCKAIFRIKQFLRRPELPDKVMRQHPFGFYLWGTGRVMYTRTILERHITEIEPTLC